MEHPIPPAETPGHSVVVRTGGIFAEPQLVVDGVAATPVDGKYVLPLAAGGKSIEIRLRTPMLDFVPIVEIDGRRAGIAPPLPSWVFLWCLLPTILLIFFGRGVLPALVGMALSYVGLYQARAAPPARRYLWSGVFNALALAAVVAMQLAMRHHGGHAGR